MTRTHETSVPVRFRDLDTMNHVNNAVYLTYLEQARGQFFMDVLEVPFEEINGVLANVEIEFRHPIELGDDVTIATSMEAVSNSSFTMAFEIRADDEVAATAESVQVYVNRDTGTPTALPDAWRETLSEWVAA